MTSKSNEQKMENILEKATELHKLKYLERKYKCYMDFNMSNSLDEIRNQILRLECHQLLDETDRNVSFVMLIGKYFLELLDDETKNELTEMLSSCMKTVIEKTEK